MTTETRPQVDAADVYRSIGDLQRDVGKLEGEMTQMSARLDDMSTQLARMDRRIDRLETLLWRILIAIIGTGGAVIVMLIATILTLVLTR